MPLNEDVNKLLKDTGIAAAGGLRANVDALTAATGMPFSTLKETIEGLVLLVGWAADVMPKSASELGVELSGKLSEDAKLLREAAGVDKSTLALELQELCTQLGVTSAKQEPLLEKCPALTVPKTPAVKKIEAPCVCTKSADACRDCHAKEHPSRAGSQYYAPRRLALESTTCRCVCKSILCGTLDQPMVYCKAKVHECLCEHRFRAEYSYDPGIKDVSKGPYDSTWNGRIYGTGLCRQHNVVNIDDSDDEPPPRKKVKKERRRGG